jgi:GT2 family glycosyltransferase
MQDVTRDTPATGISMVSGCFMFFRRPVLEKLGGFDGSFFLYFEDFDLSLRAATQGEVAYVPAVRIQHDGGAAARKGLRHIRWFATSALHFYRLHGWKWV